MSKKYLGAVIAALLIAFAITACGEDEDTASQDTASQDTASQEATAQEADREFIAGMIPHHESAIEMAEMAQEEGERPEIRELADEIVAAQEAEIGELEAAHERIFGEPVEESGESMDMSGMSTDMDELAGADEFDQMFIDMMVPHHQDAIEMARTELAEGEDPELHEIAQRIIDAQAAEIEEMNSWREEWYGEPSPAGGVPPEGEESVEPSGDMEDMGH